MTKGLARASVTVITQEYSPDIQSRLICGLAVLHNFIRAYDPTDIPDELELETATVADDETARTERMTARLADRAVGNKERTWASEHRESIALAMWADYWRRRRGREAHFA
jgi:hypothetical protein